MSDDKKMCKLKKKLLKDDIDSFVELVNSPKYVCKKCGRVANDKDRLCKPYKI